MVKRFLYLMSLINIALGIILLFLGNKYAYVESVMGRWLYVLIVGVIMFYFIKKVSNSKFKILCVCYPIILIISGILIFLSIPNYSYKEAVLIIEKNTGEKSIESKEVKSTNGLYYIYNEKWGIYIWSLGW